jgi:hypothetical protein
LGIGLRWYGSRWYGSRWYGSQWIVFETGPEKQIDQPEAQFVRYCGGRVAVSEAVGAGGLRGLTICVIEQFGMRTED